MISSTKWALQGRHLRRGSLSALQNAVVLAWKGDERQNHILPGLINVRFFSAAPDPKEKDSGEEGNVITRTFRTVLTPRNQFYALVAGGTIGAYAISRVFLGFTTFFTHLTPTVIAKWGFYTGFGCASGELIC